MVLLIRGKLCTIGYPSFTYILAIWTHSSRLLKVSTTLVFISVSRDCSSFKIFCPCYIADTHRLNNYVGQVMFIIVAIPLEATCKVLYKFSE